MSALSVAIALAQEEAHGKPGLVLSGLRARGGPNPNGDGIMLARMDGNHG